MLSHRKWPWNQDLGVTRKSHTDDFLFIKKIRKFTVTAEHSSQQKETFHSNHPIPHFHIRAEKPGYLQLCMVFCSSNNRDRVKETHFEILILSKLSFSQLYTETQKYLYFTYYIFYILNTYVLYVCFIYSKYITYASIHI